MKRLQDIIIGNDVVGHIYGINLKPLNISNKEDIEEYIFNIKEFIELEYTSIYIEEELPLEVIKIVEDSLSISSSVDNDIRLYNIPHIIEALIPKIKRDICKEEILIISHKREKPLELLIVYRIDLISSQFLD